jgi:hypothetical protein
MNANLVSTLDCVKEAYLEALQSVKPHTALCIVSRYERLTRSTKVSETSPLHGLELHGVNLSD